MTHYREHFRPLFNRSIHIDEATITLTEDTGAIPLREVADELGVTAGLARLHDLRDPALITHPLMELSLTRIFLMALGWRDQDDADRLRQDPALRISVSERKGERPLAAPHHSLEPTGLASQPTLSRHLEALAGESNLKDLDRLLLDVAADRVGVEYGHQTELIFDVDSCPIDAHGRQEGALYNGYYRRSIMHPNTLFSATGDLWAVELRPGNVGTANGVQTFIEPALERAKELTDKVWLRFDAGYASGDFFDWLDEREIAWLTRLKTNTVLARQVEEWKQQTLATWSEPRQSPGKPRTATREFTYRAKKWKKERRVMAVLVERSNHSRQGELFNHLFFLSTSVTMQELASEDLLSRYRARGNVERHIGELVGVLAPKVSSATMAMNQATMVLSALAYQLMHHLRERLEGVADEGISLQCLRERFLKTAAQVVRHARRVVFRVSHAKQDLWMLLAEALAPIEDEQPQEGLA